MLSNAYVIFELTVHDARGMLDYVSQVQATLDPYGGRFIARGGPAQSLEGSPVTGRVAMMEFPSAEAAQGWFRSPAYRKIKPIRQRSAEARVYLLDGSFLD
jgi:uncharacterized protein (DUF1330 family)